jgi:hypothetical protein
MRRSSGPRNGGVVGNLFLRDPRVLQLTAENNRAGATTALMRSRRK